MSDILKVLFIFVIIVLLLRKRVGVGYVLLAASGVLAALYVMSPSVAAATVWAAVTDPVTVKLAVALTLIRIFEVVLREKEVLSAMMEASRSLLKSTRAVIVSMPLLIGMLPSVGGAYFSAPMVDEATKGVKMSQEEKGFVNYWFRHPWEYVLPLYPGIVLASAISGIELWRLIVANASYAAAVVMAGFIFSMRGVGKKKGKRPAISLKGLLSFTPIVMVFMLVVVLRVELHWGLMISVVVLLLYYRYPLRGVWGVIRRGFSLDVVILIVGVMLFKEVMQATGAVANMSGYFTLKGIPLMPMLFLLPFITGLLTGVAVGYVGAALPLLISLMPEPSLWALSFAYACGFVGVLMSPVHVCLILTREYFKADMWGIYKRILPAGALVLAVAAVQYLIMA